MVLSEIKSMELRERKDIEREGEREAREVSPTSGGEKEFSLKCVFFLRGNNNNGRKVENCYSLGRVSGRGGFFSLFFTHEPFGYSRQIMGLIVLVFISSTARLMELSPGYMVTNFSSGSLPCLQKAVSCGMNTCGTESP